MFEIQTHDSFHELFAYLVFVSKCISIDIEYMHRREGFDETIRAHCSCQAYRDVRPTFAAGVRLPGRLKNASSRSSDSDCWASLVPPLTGALPDLSELRPLFQGNPFRRSVCMRARKGSACAGFRHLVSYSAGSRGASSPKINHKRRFAREDADNSGLWAVLGC